MTVASFHIVLAKANRFFRSGVIYFCLGLSRGGRTRLVEAWEMMRPSK